MKKSSKQIEIRKAEKRQPEGTRKKNGELALEKLRSLRRPFPPDFRFDRDDANAR